MDPIRKKKLEKCVLQILKHGDMDRMTESKVRKLAAEETGFDLTDPAFRKTVKRVVQEFFIKDPNEADEDEVEANESIKVPAKHERRRNCIEVEEDAEEEVKIKPTDKDEESGDDEDNLERRKDVGKKRSLHASATNERKRQMISIEEDEEEEDEEEEDEGRVDSVKRKMPIKNEKSRNTKQKDVEEEEEEGGEEEVERRQATKRPKSQPVDNDNSIVLQLSKKRNVAVQEFKGRLLISIRDYYEKEGKLLPTSKGISLTIDQWETFKDGIPEIEAAIKRFRR